MGSTQRILLTIVALTFVGACSYVPRMSADTELSGIRAQYLHDNPGGSYNDYIIKGEIVQGMNFDEVLASWGVPTHREGETESSGESWTYLIKDPDSPDYLLYDLAFENRVMSRWTLDRHVSRGGGVTQSIITSHTSTLPATANARTGGVDKRN